MHKVKYNWKRYWCPREGHLNLTDNGYLLDPEGKYSNFCGNEVRRYEDIATMPCLILLGEPGIGKTTAMDQVAAEEERQQSIARIDLGAYSSEDRLIHDLREDKTIRSWIDGQTGLSLLLDSLDECLIHVKTVAKLLNAELARMPVARLRLRLACRTAEWPSTLEDTLRGMWGAKNVGVYELAPLTRKAVSAAAIQSGHDAEAFLQEIARVRAQPLAIKPVSLNLLLNLFARYHRLPGKEADLYEQGCALLCEELPERKAAHVPHACTTAQRYAVARRIAYVTIFSGTSAVWTAPADGTVPPGDLLIKELCGKEPCDGVAFTVDEDAIRDTLNTGLFTARGPNRLGWAHQTYAEFLASQYILAKLNPRQRESLLLLSDTIGAGVIPQLSEVAARIATSDKELFERMLKTCPAVLLRSDVATTDYAQRAALLREILRMCNAEEILYQDVDHSDRLRHLNHPEIVEQLRPVITENKNNIYARMVALETLAGCRNTELLPEILGMALDNAAHIELRCRGVDILGLNINAAVAARLRSLTEDMPDDPACRLKGHVLSILWPKFLTAEDLFRVITPKHGSRLICAYDMFLSHGVATFLKPGDMPIALAWAKAQGRRHDLEHYFQQLIDAVLIKAWEYLDENGVLCVFAETLSKRLDLDYGHIVDSSDFENTNFLKNERKRRLLLCEMVLQIAKEYSATCFDNSGCSYIATSEDFFWLLERTITAFTENEAGVWARLCRRSYNAKSAAHTDALLAAYEGSPALRGPFRPLVEPISLNSPEAQKLREEQREFDSFNKRHDKPPLIKPPPAVRIQRLLERCENGDPFLWWAIVREMTLEPRSTHYGNFWDPDITKLAGWSSADEQTRSRITDTAKRYIVEGSDLRDEWLPKDSFVNCAANAGYQAMRLIHTSEPSFVRGMSPETWAKWAVGILFHPQDLDDEEAQKYHTAFTTVLFEKAPAEASKALEAIIQRESRQSKQLPILDRVEHIRCVELSELLRRLIADKALSAEGATGVLMYLLQQEPAQTRALVLNLLRMPLAKDGTDREYAVAAAKALWSTANAETWPAVWAAMCTDLDFGRRLIGEMADFLRAKEVSFQRLSEEQLTDLYVWVARAFPHAEDPAIQEAHFVGQREIIARWRDGLLQALKNRGTVAACYALNRAVNELPHLPWLRYVWLEALKLTRSQTWQPLSPPALLKLAETGQARVVSSGLELLDVLQESLERLQVRLRGETPMAQFLWDYQHANKTWRPKDENTLSEFVAQHLRDDLAQGGIVVNREVQIRPRRGDAKGEQTDIHVDAVVIGPDGTTCDVIQSIVETKGCWHNELNTAMKTQLVDRYLKDNQCQQGLYLVGYFMCGAWDDADCRKKATPVEELADLERRLFSQAGGLSVNGLTVRAKVLDIRLSSTASDNAAR